LRGHPGAPGVPVPPDQAAPAVLRPGQGGAAALAGRRRHDRAGRAARGRQRVTGSRPVGARAGTGPPAEAGEAAEAGPGMADAPERWPVLSSVEHARSHVVTLRTDRVL